MTIIDQIAPRQTVPGYGLKSDLARLCLPAANRDPNRELAWMNSICVLFLLIGILGARPPEVVVRPLPPLDVEIIPAIIEPIVPATQAQEQAQEQETADQDQPAPPQVVAVTLDAPSINFAVPTMSGNLLVPSAVAKAPPLAPMAPPRAVAPLKNLPVTLDNTGVGGERPAPTAYPKLAQDLGQQGAVTLLLTAGDASGLTSIEVAVSSGFPILDRHAKDWVKRHWTLPSGPAGRLFEVTFNYRLPAR